MICSGKHQAGVRISFLEGGEGSVLLIGGCETAAHLGARSW